MPSRSGGKRNRFWSLLTSCFGKRRRYDFRHDFCYSYKRKNRLRALKRAFRKRRLSYKPRGLPSDSDIFESSIHCDGEPVLNICLGFRDDELIRGYRLVSDVGYIYRRSVSEYVRCAHVDVHSFGENDPLIDGLPASVWIDCIEPTLNVLVSLNLLKRRRSNLSRKRFRGLSGTRPPRSRYEHGDFTIGNRFLIGPLPLPNPDIHQMEPTEEIMTAGPGNLEGMILLNRLQDQLGQTRTRYRNRNRRRAIQPYSTRIDLQRESSDLDKRTSDTWSLQLDERTSDTMSLELDHSRIREDRTNKSCNTDTSETSDSSDEEYQTVHEYVDTVLATRAKQSCFPVLEDDTESVTSRELSSDSSEMISDSSEISSDSSESDLTDGYQSDNEQELSFSEGEYQEPGTFQMSILNRNQSDIDDETSVLPPDEIVCHQTSSSSSDISIIRESTEITENDDNFGAHDIQTKAIKDASIQQSFKCSRAECDTSCDYLSDDSVGSGFMAVSSHLINSNEEEASDTSGEIADGIASISLQSSQSLSSCDLNQSANNNDADEESEVTSNSSDEELEPEDKPDTWFYIPTLATFIPRKARQFIGLDMQTFESNWKTYLSKITDGKMDTKDGLHIATVLNRAPITRFMFLRDLRVTLDDIDARMKIVETLSKAEQMFYNVLPSKYQIPFEELENLKHKSKKKHRIKNKFKPLKDKRVKSPRNRELRQNVQTSIQDKLFASLSANLQVNTDLSDSDCSCYNIDSLYPDTARTEPVSDADSLDGYVICNVQSETYCVSVDNATSKRETSTCNEYNPDEKVNVIRIEVAPVEDADENDSVETSRQDVSPSNASISSNQSSHSCDQEMTSSDSRSRQSNKSSQTMKDSGRKRVYKTRSKTTLNAVKEAWPETRNVSNESDNCDPTVVNVMSPEAVCYQEQKRSKFSARRLLSSPAKFLHIDSIRNAFTRIKRLFVK